MSRTRARVTQADIARVVRAAKQAGASAIEMRTDGTLLILLTAPENKAPPPRDDAPDIVL